MEWVKNTPPLRAVECIRRQALSKDVFRKFVRTIAMFMEPFPIRHRHLGWDIEGTFQVDAPELVRMRLTFTKVNEQGKLLYQYYNALILRVNEAGQIVDIYAL